MPRQEHPKYAPVGLLQKEKGVKPEKFNLRREDTFNWNKKACLLQESKLTTVIHACNKVAKFEEAPKGFPKAASDLMNDKTSLATFAVLKSKSKKCGYQICDYQGKWT